MDYISSFKTETRLIDNYGEGNAFLVWVMGLYLDISDLQTLADESLTDDYGDKKIDFLRVDVDLHKIYVVQGYYTKKNKDNAPANKASDLNTAAAWLTTGDVAKLPVHLKDIVLFARDVINKGEVNEIELMYVHNCGESVPVEQELKTAADYFKKALSFYNIGISFREIGNQTAGKLFKDQNTNIKVLGKVTCPFKSEFSENNPLWNAIVLSVSGEWLRTIYLQYKEDLFSANYRGFLGFAKKKINAGIKNTADKAPGNFWAYNNGITILTNKIEDKKDKIVLHGISVINGAQTTGSIGSLDLSVDLKNVKILTRIIECNDSSVIDNIVKYNNTQNQITSWDKFGNHPYQTEIEKQFSELHHAYSSKRGFENRSSQLSIENCVQSLVSFLGQYKDANKSKVVLFESDKLYKDAFAQVKARHILFVYCLEQCIVQVRTESRATVKAGINVSSQDKQMYEFFASLNSKQFMIAIIAELITKLFVDLNVKKEISFTPHYSDNDLHSINRLVVEIKPFVKSAIGFIVTYNQDNKSLIDHYKEDDIITLVANHAASIFNTLANVNGEIKEMENNFRQMICNG